MPPKRPPPLPKSLFVSGPLSPGFMPAPPPPSPSSVHPEFIADAHNQGIPLHLHEGELKVTPPVTATVAVVLPGQPVAQPGLNIAQPGEPPRLGKHHVATARLVTDTERGTGSLPAEDLLVPATTPLTDAQWDRVDEAVNEIDGGWGAVEKQVAEGESTRKILLSGLLPPPLTKPSSPLLQSEEYHLHCARLASLSLHSDVVLKALPPVVDTRVATPEGWWEDEKELERVIKMYMAPAIETFGTHRIVFGSLPALPPSDPSVKVPAQGSRWYAILRKCISELGEDSHAMTKIMGANALKLYRLED